MMGMAIPRQPHSDWLARLRSIAVLRPGQRILNLPGIGVTTSRRAVSAGGGNGLLNALVGYWPLDEAAGANNALDLHTNGLTLTQVSSPGADTGPVYATARTFDGSADYFTRASETLLVTGDVDFTIAAWVYIASKTAYAHIASKVQAVEEWLLRYESGSDRFLFETHNAGGYPGATASNYGSPPTSTWLFVVGWHDSASNVVGISVNGGTPNTTASAGGVLTSTDAFQIGAQSPGAYLWNGRIGPVAFWKSAAGGGGVLSAEQRTSLYNAGAGLAYADFTT